MSDEDYDFGFTAVEDLTPVNQLYAKEQEATIVALKKEIDYYRQCVEKMNNAIIPLLNNLLKDSDKDYIYWPKRHEKIKAFQQKIKKLTKEYETSEGRIYE